MDDAAFVPLAGRGKRLKPLTDNIPKALLELHGKPMAERVVNQIISCGIYEIHFVIGYLGAMVQSYFTTHKPSNIDYSFIKQQNLDGTAGALKLAKSQLRGKSFVVIFGDGYFEIENLRSVINSKSELACAVTEVPDPERYGVVELAGNGMIQSVQEKPSQPKSNLVLAGIYKFSQDIWTPLDDLKISPRGEYEIPDLITNLVALGKDVEAVPISGMRDIGTIAELEAINNAKPSDSKSRGLYETFNQN